MSFFLMLTPSRYFFLHLKHWLLLYLCAYFKYYSFALYIFSPADGGSMFLQNVGIYLQVNIPLQPTRPTLTSSLSESQISQVCSGVS
jgi:hypothetical protein